MRRAAIIGFVWLLAVAVRPALSQNDVLSFDVASVKPTDAAGDVIDVSIGTVTGRAARIATCIAWAYDLQPSQVVAATASVSGLLSGQRYDILAKTGGRPSIEQLKKLTQSLLADRFNLRVHREQREMQSYTLVVDKNGPKFKESQGDGDSAMRMTSRLTRQWTHTTIAQFARQLSDAMQAPVVDDTALPARYDLALDLTPFLPPNNERPDLGAMMITAVQEQLGLKLVGRRTLVEVLVVDRVERPSPD